MLNIKSIKEFRGLDNKARIAKAREIGSQFSEGTAYGMVASLALASGIDAKERGDKTFTFDSAFDAFADGYFSNATDGTIKAYRSAFNVWTKAGMKTEWDATDVAVRVFNEAKYALTQRSGMLSRLLKSEKAPTAKEYAAAKPKTGNHGTGATVVSASAGLARAVGNFAVDWSDELSKPQSVMLAALIRDAKALEASIAASNAKPEPKVTKGKGKATEPSAADKRKAMEAKFLALLPKGSVDGTKTIQ